MHLENRFRYLYTGELTAAILFIGLSALVNYTYPYLSLYASLAFWSAFILLEVLLVQGSYYWYHQLKSYRKRQRIPLQIVRQLYRFQRINWFIMPIPLIIFIIEASSISWQTWWLRFAIYVFALLEYINYFHVQLSYDNVADIRYLCTHKQLKRATLQKDFQRLKE
ncbi:hypothetical protein [Caryophanon tenue]|uniref:General stress protein n=1 Tax=Caryophanon tenue TaxID=33978 RepID=A0A1C0Y6Y7_9BACL|nr:hypothetical protein [Caryophanon tenue]OCS82903.1 hypothetical protein A6M13_05750 [Caryophanon tenue]